MASKYSRGLASIKYGTIAVDGGLASMFTQISDTVRGSAKLTTAQPTVNNVTIEESDDPVETITTPGAKTLEFATRDFNADTLVTFLGGSKVAASGGTGDVWKAPTSQPTIELSFEVADKKGNVWDIVRANVVATLNTVLTNEGAETAQLNVVATILTPTKANTPPYTLTKPV